MTRSLVVTTWFPDSQHPSRTPFCLAHVHALQDAGIDVEVIHLQLRGNGPTTQERYEGVPVTRLFLSPTRPLTWLSAFATIRRGLREVNVLHTMAFSSVLVAAVPWGLRRRPWIHTEHWNGVTNPDSVGSWWRRLAFLRHVLRLPQVVTGVTKQLADEMAGFTRPAATRVVPCVVDGPGMVEPFPPPEPLRLVGVGLLNDRKNPLGAIDTVAWLVARGVDVQYEWLGEGPLLAAAQRRAAEAGIAERVVFAGAVPPSAVPAVISSAHVFFVPSTQENFFTAAAEAIAAGRLAVLPRSGGFVEYCTPENSVLVDGWDAESLGRAVIAAQGQLADRTPGSIAATLGDRFSSAKVGRQFLTLYREVAGLDPAV